MEYAQDAAEYRERLLSGLRTGHRRSSGEATGRIQVFVNQHRVGSLDNEEADAALHVQTRSRVHSVDVRSEDGVLLGGLYAGEYAIKNARIPLGRHAIELQVQNYAHAGSVSAVFKYAPALWHRARSVLGRQVPSAGQTGPRMSAMVLTQIVLAVAIFGLAVDRVIGWRTPEHVSPVSPPPTAPLIAPVADTKKLELQLVDLAQMQAKVADNLQTQQQGMAQLQRAMARLSSVQETVASSVLTARKEIDKRHEASGPDVERMARLLITRTRDEQEELQAEIYSLTVANDRLSKERSDLEQTNQELKQRLKAAGVDISKATPSHAGSGDLAQRREENGAAQIADGRRVHDAQPFLFWVTFQEGTSEDSIERWVQEMKGRKGTRTDGWQAVEIVQPADPPDRVMNRIKDAKIVKAIRVSQ